MRRLDQISEDLLSTKGKGLEARFAEMQQFVLARLRDIQLLLKGNIARAKSELVKLCTEIILTPAEETCMLSGDWDLLGARSDAAGGQNWTEHLPVYFDWLGLPDR